MQPKLDTRSLYCTVRTITSFGHQWHTTRLIVSYFNQLLLTNCTTLFPKPDSNTSIPAVLVSHDDGDALANKYLYQTGFKIYVTSDMPPNLSYYLLPFAIVIGVCLLLTISFMIFQLIRCVQERRKAQRHRLSKKYLKKLPLQKFEKGFVCVDLEWQKCVTCVFISGIFYETCAICLDDYVDGEKIRILPCNHGTHAF